MSYKVWIQAAGETEYRTNGLAFPSEESAFAWGGNLVVRWTGVKKFEVRESDEPVNVDEHGNILPKETV